MRKLIKDRNGNLLVPKKARMEYVNELFNGEASKGEQQMAICRQLSGVWKNRCWWDVRSDQHIQEQQRTPCH